MKNMLTLAILFLSLWWINNVWGNCMWGHSDIDPQPSQVQINKFCSAYSKLKPGEQLQYKTAYNKYCKKSGKSSVSAKKPVLTRIAVKDDCLTRNSQILFKGRDFGKKGSAYMSQSGKDQELSVRRWSDKQV